MPEKGEQMRKIKSLRSGHGVRPPKKWLIMMSKGIKKQYPTHSLKRRNRIIGGIWKTYSKSAKIDIITKYQT